MFAVVATAASAAVVVVVVVVVYVIVVVITIVSTREIDQLTYHCKTDKDIKIYCRMHIILQIASIESC